MCNYLQQECPHEHYFHCVATDMPGSEGPVKYQANTAEDALNHFMKLLDVQRK